MDENKVIRGIFDMDEMKYERIEMKQDNGIKIYFEFPKTSVNGEDVMQEVKAILQGELREAIHRSAG